MSTARLWMLVACLAAIPLALAIELLWGGHWHLSMPSRFHVRWASHPWSIALPFTLAVLILTACLVAMLVSSSR